jgi:tartrate dehydrogenase/decarboxylase/D-malate dehydrogenase
MRNYKIAVIAGDGIGKEVMPEGLRALEKAAGAYGFGLDLQVHNFADCDYYAQHGRMMPEDWKDQIGRPDAIFFGAVGWPATVPDHISLWQSLLQFRREYDQYVNLRPVRLMPGVPCPLAGASRATSTFGSCAKTPKANIPASAAICSPAPSARSSFRKP